MVHTYTRKKKPLRRGKKKGAEKNRKGKKEKKENTCSQGAGRVPMGQGLLFAGTVDPKICAVDGPTEGKHKGDRTEYKTRRGQKHRAKKERSCPMSSWWAKDDT